MSEKRRLGRGLGALIPEVMAGTGEATEVKLELIKPNPYQPRRNFNNEKLDELAQSIKEHGVLQAVVLSPAGEEGEYYLIAGERRCRAAKIAGLQSIPAIIKPYDSKAMLEIALIENIQRENLNPVEEARAYQRLMKEFNYTQEELSRRLGKSRPALANSMRLLSLPETVLEKLENGLLTPGQARPLLGLESLEDQVRMAEAVIEQGLTARDVEKLTAKKERLHGGTSTDKNELGTDPLYEELQLQIQRELGTKVRIKPSSKGGMIEIYYYGDEDLERLVGKMLPKGL